LQQARDDQHDPRHDQLLSPSLQPPVRDTLVSLGRGVGPSRPTLPVELTSSAARTVCGRHSGGGAGSARDPTCTMFSTRRDGGPTALGASGIDGIRGVKWKSPWWKSGSSQEKLPPSPRRG